MKLVDRFWPFMKADYKAAEAYLEEQSRKGLHIKHIDEYGIKATYEKGEPRNIKYCIDYLTLDDKNEAEVYQTMLADAGWTYVGDLDKYLIFASEEGENPTPINTDWKEEYRIMRKGLWRYELPMGIIALVLSFFLIKTPVGMDASLERLFVEMIMLCGCAFGIVGLIYSILFYGHSWRALKKNEPMQTRSTEKARIWGTIHGTLGLCTGLGVYGRFTYVAYNHWTAGEMTAAYCLSVVLIASASSLLLVNWFQNNLSEKACKAVDVLLVICIAVGFIGYCIAV